MELKIGKMSSKELAQWFGISYGTLRNRKKVYIEKLGYFCDFTPVYGGVEITEIRTPIYSKNLADKDAQDYLEEIKKCTETQDGLSTISGMSRKFIREKKSNTSLDATKRRLSKISKELFGNPKDLISYGKAGSREYVWAIKVDDYNGYRLMTPKENDQFNSIISQSYSSSPEKVKKLKLLEKSLERDEITKDEFFETKERLKLDPFVDAIFTFRDQTGYMVVRCTKHELLESLKFEEEEQNKEKEVIPEEKE